MNKNNNIENEDFKKKYPNLSSIPKENSFNVPEGYFETLPQSIGDRINQTKKPSFISVLFPVQVRVAFASIAAIAIIFVGFLWFNKLETHDYSLYDSYVEDYLLGYYDLNPGGFYNILNEEDLFYDNETNGYTEEEESLLEYLVSYSDLYYMSPFDFDNGDN